MDYVSTWSPEQLNVLAAGGIFGAVLGSIVTVGVLFSVLQFIYWILQIIGCWKIFGKFGEPGWKSIIPFYNTWTEYKYIWNTKMAIWMWVFSIVGNFMMDQFAETNVALCWIGIILSLAGWIITLIGYNKLSKAFGHGAGYTIGLILFPGLFQIILGFGKSQYIGNTTEQH